MPRISNAGQSIARGRDLMQDTAWHFRDDVKSAPQADEARRQMRERALIELNKTDRKTGKTKPTKEVTQLFETDARWREDYQKKEIHWPHKVETEFGFQDLDGFHFFLKRDILLLEERLNSLQEESDLLWKEKFSLGMLTLEEWETNPRAKRIQKKKEIVDSEIERLNQSLARQRKKLKNYKTFFNHLMEQVLAQTQGENRDEQNNSENEDGAEELLLQPQEKMTTRVGSLTQPHLKSFQINNGHQKRFSDYTGAHNLRHKEARAGRVAGERGAAIVATQQELSRRGGGHGFLEGAPVVDQDIKPNPEQLEAQDRMSFTDRLQAGWLELGDLNSQHLRDQFDYQAGFLPEDRVASARLQYLEKLPTAVACLMDRSDPEFGPAMAQIIKLVEKFIVRNADEISKYHKNFEQQKGLEEALQKFVEDMVFRIAYFVQLEEGANSWDKKHAFHYAIDKLGDINIPEYFNHLYSKSTRLTAQVDLLSHQVRELAFTLQERPKDEQKEAKRVKTLEQKVLSAGIRQLEINDLFPLFVGGFDLGKVPVPKGETSLIGKRLANWQHPDSSNFMSEWGRMTPENAEKFNVLVKEILVKIFNFYQRFAKQVAKVDQHFKSPEETLKNALQYIFERYYNTYAPGSADSSADRIVSHFEDSIGKIAEGMYTSPLRDVEYKLRDLQEQMAGANKIKKVELAREIEEIKELRQEAKRLQDYLYKVSERARSLATKVEKVA